MHLLGRFYAIFCYWLKPFLHQAVYFCCILFYLLLFVFTVAFIDLFCIDVLPFVFASGLKPYWKGEV